jgi:hypothetical protein
MLKIFAPLLITLSGCCPDIIAEFNKLEVLGSSEGYKVVFVYDRASDTAAWIDTETMRVRFKFKHWMHR